MDTVAERRVADPALEKLRPLLAGRPFSSQEHSHWKPSAVLVLVYRKRGAYCLLLNKRTEHVEFNKGEICLPGGARDPQDPDLKATALREAFEEMGIRPEDVSVLGELDETTTRAGFVIHPYVGTIPYPYAFRPSAPEVAKVLEVPISALRDAHNVRVEVRLQPDGTQAAARSYAWGRYLIFGATARILQQFLSLTSEVPELNGEPAQ